MITKLSIVLAARSRPDMLAATVARTLPNITLSGTRLLLALDDDDHANIEAARSVAADNVVLSIRPREDSFGGKYNRVLIEATADVYLAMVDYAPHVTPGFDRIILEAAALFPDGIGIVYNQVNTANALIFAQMNAVTHRLAELMGGIYPGWFPYWFIDHWLDDIARMIGRIAYADVEIDGTKRPGHQALPDPHWWADFFDLLAPRRQEIARKIIAATDDEAWRKKMLLGCFPHVARTSRYINESLRSHFQLGGPGVPNANSGPNANNQIDARYERIKQTATAVAQKIRAASQLAPDVAQTLSHATELAEQKRWEAAAQELYALNLQGKMPEVFHMNLGLYCLRAGRLPEAEAAFHYLLRNDLASWSAYDGLADVYGRAGRLDESISAGQKALALRDAAVQPNLAPLPYRRNGKRVISFSLFGSDPLYCNGAITNARMATHVYPGWECRFYVDDTVPATALEQLRKLAVVIRVPDDAPPMPGTMWRFLALDDPAVAVVIFRDADSVVGSREAEFVAEWLESGQPFHIIRDAFAQTELILAGAWGARGGALPPLASLMRPWLEAYPDDIKARNADQRFLRFAVWPYARRHALTHDPVFQYGNTLSPHAHRVPLPEHIGARIQRGEAA